jgi:hypothetical protein
MKKILLLVATVGILNVAYSQDSAVTAPMPNITNNVDTVLTPMLTKNMYFKQPTLTVSFFVNDFATDNTIPGNYLANIFKGKSVNLLKEAGPGFGLTYREGLHNYFDWSVSLQASIVKYYDKKVGSFKPNDVYTELLAKGVAKLFPDNAAKYPVTPYLTAGLGFAHFYKFVPLALGGFGIQGNIMGKTYIFLEGLYVKGISANASSYAQYSIGFGAPIGEKRHK